MERHAFALKIKEGKKNQFKANLGKVWPGLTALLDAHEATNFSMWNVLDMVFGYFETAGELVYTDADKEKAAQWEAAYGDCYDWISVPFQEMRLVYEEFGVVRECKELIRHRVFITKLYPGKEEEYKSAHDELIEARNGQIPQGPDSNFSIWCAGGYVFGYDEIDVTMDFEWTPEERQWNIDWENRMLGLMSWLTDDIDFMLDERHENIIRLGFHN